MTPPDTQVERTPEITTAQVAYASGLEKIWESSPGLWGFITSVDHKEIGKKYIVTSFILLFLGGIEALVMRLQLAQPDQQIITPEQYNNLFSMHGVTMIFLYAFPILTGFSVFLFPLFIGARDMAFPRLNAFSYWIFLAASIFMYVGFAMGAGPNDGWFNYVPYALRPYNPGLNQDFYSLGMIFLGISTTLGAANFIVTFFRLRCPGMSVNRVPIMMWGTLTAAAANILVVPAVSLAFFFLWMDRQFGTRFFEVSQGGQPLLWQHLFWMFAHPWVYAIVLPAMGMVSDGLPIFCRRPLVGYTPVALATVTTMVLGFGVWVHHMFATGLPGLAISFFSGVSIIIAIPSAVAVFSWVATIWTGRPVITTAFLYFSSMILLFVIGGVSGFMTAAAPADWQFTDTYFVVAHIHYVLIGINVFPVIGALYTWFPKMTGRMLDETLGKASFWINFTGFNLAFLPMHLTGLWGMPRRIYTYPPDMGWDWLNMLTTIGAYMLAFGLLLLVINVVVSLMRGRIAGANPWDGPSLEWSTSSPPPPYNFAVIPQVSSRHPLWEKRLKEGEELSTTEEGMILDHGHETIGTSPLDGQPELILKMPGETPLPFIITLAMSAGFAGLLVHLWWLAAASTLVILLLTIVWLWPERRLNQRVGGHV